jgi:hypothetical protein
MPQHPDRDVAQPAELSDGEHDSAIVDPVTL